MVPTSPGEPLEINAFNTIARLTISQTQIECINSTHTQPMYSNSASDNQTINSSLQNNNVQPHDEYTVILQQLSKITEELRNFMDKVSGDITKIT